VSHTRGIQYETVATVADALVAHGAKPEQISTYNIRQETGTGSLSTINNHLKQWKLRASRGVVPVNFSDDDLQTIIAIMTSKIEEAAVRLRQEEAIRMKVVVADRERFQQENAEALRINDEIEAELEAAREKAKTHEGELEKLRLKIARLKGQIAALTGKAEHSAAQTPKIDDATPASGPRRARRRRPI
jgi:chromosome segregation ATPase